MSLVPFPGAPLPAAPDPHDYQDDTDATGKMSFLEHLDELRKRLIVAISSIAVGFLIGLLFVDRVEAFVMRPLYEILPEGGSFIFTGPPEAFFIRMKIAALIGLMVAAPVVISQVWLFIAPGLYAHEKRFAIPFVLFSTVFFVAGAAFSHFVVFRWAWQFFGSYSTDYMVFMPSLRETFSLYVRMLLGIGLVFEMPTLVLFLARMGVVTAGFLWRQTKYAILLIFIVAAIITPTPDPVTQTLMAGPMLGLYLISIVIAWVFQKRSADGPRRE
jgi:sec-independent protein translocase protein TatC